MIEELQAHRGVICCAALMLVFALVVWCLYWGDPSIRKCKVGTLICLCIFVAMMFLSYGCGPFGATEKVTLVVVTLTATESVP